MLINSNKNMNLKNYRKARIIITFLLAMGFSYSLTIKNYFLAVMLLIPASLILWYLRNRVTEVIADERDYQLAGKAALLAMQIFGWVAVVLMFLFYYLQEFKAEYGLVSSTLSYSVMGLFLLYAILFRFGRKIFKK